MIILEIYTFYRSFIGVSNYEAYYFTAAWNIYFIFIY